ncbi:MAG: phosphoribosylformimino-5-aminoimidazole carboxamide ribotide isomerase [Pirellulaceae bacterium]
MDSKVLLPVIDLMNAEVVHAVAGERKSYQPVRSVLFDSTVAAEIARILAQQCGCSDIYVADLDAIRGDAPNSADWKSIEASGLSLLLDAGVSSVADLTKIRSSLAANSQLVIGLENLANPQTLRTVGAACLPRDIFSLDLRAGNPLASGEWKDLTPLQIASLAYESDFRRMIVLDLAQVGTGQGSGTVELIGAIKQIHGDVELIGGGGVRCQEDVERLQKAGCSRVLVASALHNGWL